MLTYVDGFDIEAQSLPPGRSRPAGRRAAGGQLRPSLRPEPHRHPRLPWYISPGPAFPPEGPRPPRAHIVMAEGNDTAVKIVEEGRTGAWRHLHGTHRTKSDWTAGGRRQGQIPLTHAKTNEWGADLMTNGVD